MQRKVKTTKRVAVVVSKQQNKQNKSRSNTRKGSAQVRQESIYAPVSIGIPRRTDNRENHFPFKRKEFISTIEGSPLFSARRFIINPGDSATFPWLSKMAQCFESYKLKKCRFIYIPRCPSSTPGLVALSPDMNPKDPQPITIQEALQNYKAGNDSSWKTFGIELSNEMLNKRKSFFNRPLAAEGDIDLYDCGNLTVITEGQADNGTVGQLWIEYEGEFLTPEGRQNPSSSTVLISGNAGSGVTNANPISNGVEMRAQTGEIIGQIVGDGTGSVLSFLKPFHGIINLNGQAAANITNSNPWSITSLNALKPILTSLTEPNPSGGLGFGINQQVRNTTLANMSNMIRAPAGGQLRVGWNTAEALSVSQVAMTSCAL